MCKFYMKFGFYIFTKNIILNIILALLLAAAVLFFYSIYVNNYNISFAMKATDDLIEDNTLYYFSSPFKDIPTEPRYWELNALEGVSEICYQDTFEITYKGAELVVRAISAYVLQNLELPLSRGEWKIEENDEDITYGVAYYNSPLNIGDVIRVDGGSHEIIITGILKRNTPVFNFSGMSTPMTCDDFFDNNKNNNINEVLCVNTYITETLPYDYSSSVLIKFEESADGESLAAACIYLSNFGRVVSLTGIYDNSIEKKQNIIMMLLPFAVSFTVVLALLIMSSIIYLAKKNSEFISIFLILGARKKHVISLLLLNEAALILFSVLLSLPLYNKATYFFTSISLGVGPYFIVLAIIGAVYLVLTNIINFILLYSKSFLSIYREGVN